MRSVCEVRRLTEVELERGPVIVPREHLERAGAAAGQRLAVRTCLDPVDVRLDGRLEDSVGVPVDSRICGCDHGAAVEAEHGIPLSASDAEVLVEEPLEERGELLGGVVERTVGIDVAGPGSG